MNMIMIMVEEEIGIKTGLICCGIYGFIVWNNFRTLRLQSQDYTGAPMQTHEKQVGNHERENDPILDRHL